MYGLKPHHHTISEIPPNESPIINTMVPNIRPINQSFEQIPLGFRRIPIKAHVVEMNNMTKPIIDNIAPI